MMNKLFLVLAVFVATTVLSLATQTNPALAAPATDTILAQGGPIRITAIFHGTVQVEHRGKVVVVDPFSPGSYNKKADLILITHTHPDHLDVAAIRKVLKPGTIVICPPAAASQITALRRDVFVQTMRNGQKSFGTTNNRKAPLWLRVDAVPAYNLVRGPQPGQKYHPKGQFNGYVVTLGGKRLYFAGDTEGVPEMRNLKRIDAAFLPMNLPYTMTPQEAARAALSFRPKTVYPYHFRYPFNKVNTNPQQFTAALRGSRIKVKHLDFYPAAGVARAG